ncbi:MAG: Rieske (2Fe-2S) protein [Steroidobacteraceae bacterium]|jgi:nitrite reductase/ring-hydroxylating ferredoxin subunit|nr:Rieske (2Fe-2S) protein [Gammaproteobacteria bacterium]
MASAPEFVAVCQLTDLQATGSRGFVLGGGDWPLRGLVVRTHSGDIRAFVNRCPHAGHRLELREHDFLSSDRQWIQCRSHGALFDLDQGRCVAGPCPGRQLTQLPVQILDKTIRIARPANSG